RSYVGRYPDHLPFAATSRHFWDSDWSANRICIGPKPLRQTFVDQYYLGRTGSIMDVEFTSFQQGNLHRSEITVADVSQLRRHILLHARGDRILLDAKAGRPGSKRSFGRKRGGNHTRLFSQITQNVLISGNRLGGVPINSSGKRRPSRY